MIFKSKSGSTFNANVIKNKGIKEVARLRGHYKANLFGPVFVSDTQFLLDNTYLTKEDVVEGKIHKSLADKIIARYTQHQNKLERIFSGGSFIWQQDFSNIVVNEGLDHILSVVLAGGTQDTTWFVGLLAGSPSPLASWTATEIAANDFVDYDESTLPAFTPGAVSSQSVDNSASKASFSINQDGSTIGGAYLIGTDAKATPAGTLYSAGAFTIGNKSADSGDTLQVQATFTSADDGA